MPPATLDDLVSAALEHHRSVLATLVRERVTKLVDELVELELNGRTNGADAAEAPDGIRPDSGTREAKRCRDCGEMKPVHAYEKHRAVCRSCRRQQVRESRQRREREPEPELEAHSTAPTG
jgi:ribosomal protein S14